MNIEIQKIFLAIPNLIKNQIKKVEDNNMKKIYAKVFMKRLSGVIVILLSVVFGIYFGLYQCLFNSIVAIINAIKAGFEAVPIAWGIVKIFAGIPVVWYLTNIGMIAGLGLLIDDFY